MAESVAAFLGVEANRELLTPDFLAQYDAFLDDLEGRNDELVELANTGTVNTFSVSFVNTDASRRKTPQVPVVVDIDGKTATNQ